jgi:hypothetical protein
MGGLDYIVSNNGTISDAVASQVWSGDAVVYVSIVNWIKGTYSGTKNLSIQMGDSIDSPFKYSHPKEIGPSLSLTTDVSSAISLRANAEARCCYQGQTHGHEGFLLSVDTAPSLLKANPEYRRVLHPYMIADDLIGTIDCQPSRYVIDFRSCTLLEARKYTELYKKIEEDVLPWVKEQAEKERVKTGKDTGPRQSHARRWWKFWRTRDELMATLATLERYVACARVTRRPIFEFVSRSIHPNDALQIFALDDDYSFGILQSSIHWEWFTARCSTLKADWRYTSNTVFDSFPWPQNPSRLAVEQVATAARELRRIRLNIMREHKLSLRELYKLLDEAVDNQLSHVQAVLDDAVRMAYEIPRKTPVLEFLLNLNTVLASSEEAGETVQGPGIPPTASQSKKLTSNDCVRIV